MKWMGWACSFVRVLRMFSNAAVSHCDYRYVRIDQTLRGNTVGYLCVNCGFWKTWKFCAEKKNPSNFRFCARQLNSYGLFRLLCKNPPIYIVLNTGIFWKIFKKWPFLGTPKNGAQWGLTRPISHSHVRPRKKKINFFFSIKKILKKFFFSSIIFFFYFFFKYFFFWKKFSIKK